MSEIQELYSKEWKKKTPSTNITLTALATEQKIPEKGKTTMFQQATNRPLVPDLDLLFEYINYEILRDKQVSEGKWDNVIRVFGAPPNPFAGRMSMPSNPTPDQLTDLKTAYKAIRGSSPW